MGKLFFLFSILVFNYLQSEVYHDGSIIPILLLDKIPLRFFYHSFLSEERKKQNKLQDVYDVAFSFRNKIIFPQNITLETAYYFFDNNSKVSHEYDININYKLLGSAKILTMGGDYFFLNSGYYCSIYAPFFWSNNQIKVRSVKNDHDLKNYFFKKFDVYESVENFSISNIEIVFGSDFLQKDNLNLGYYLYFITPNIPGIAFAFEYKPFTSDTKSLTVHIESTIAFNHYQENINSYKKKSFNYYFSQSTGDLFYSESMINFLYQIDAKTINLGYSFITQDCQRSEDLIATEKNFSDEKTFFFPKKKSSQWLSVFYGGYTYSTDYFSIVINSSYNFSFKDHFTPSFYDFVFVFGYNF